MNKYCVYIHERADIGTAFYVGKGAGKRWKSATGRSLYWKRISDKHGWRARKVSDNMPEPCSFSLERALIACHKDTICNLTSGGEGASGRKPTAQQREKCSKSNKGTPPSQAAKHAAASRNSKPIGTRCGLRFDSMAAAIRWLGLGDAAKANISQVARGRTGSAYGYEWGFIQNGEPVFLYRNRMSEPRPARWQAVACDGMEFPCISHAVDWMRKNGFPKANTGALCRSAKYGVQMYGMVWRYV